MSVRSYLAALASCLPLLGCGVQEEDYAVEYPEAVCTAYEACGYLEDWVMDYSVCLESQPAPTCGEGTSHSAAVARQCLAQIEEVSCESLLDGVEAATESCDEVCELG